MNEPEIKDKTRLNGDAGLIRVLALATMLIDHVGHLFFSRHLMWRVVGRMSFPLFCWGIVLGCLNTKNHPRYALRLLLLALASQWPYMLGMGHQADEHNVVFTLLLGMLAVTAIQKNKWGSALWGPVLSVAAACAFKMDYGWRGVLLMVFMYLARDSRGGFAAMMTAFCLFWGTTSMDVSHLFLLPGGGEAMPEVVRQWLTLARSFLRLQSLALIALPVLLIQTHSGIRLPKWFTYLAYPGHLLLLWLLNH